MFLFAACCDKLFSDARDPANEGLIYSSGTAESDSREFIAIQRCRSAVSAHRTLETTSETSFRYEVSPAKCWKLRKVSRSPFRKGD